MKVRFVTLKLLPSLGLKCADSLGGPRGTPTGLCAAVTAWCVPSGTESWSQTTSYTSHTLGRRAASASLGPSPCYKWRPRIIQLYFIFELGMTSVADFKKCLLVLRVILSVRSGPFQKSRPQRTPCLGQDERHRGFLQNTWAAACPVIRIALGVKLCKRKGG